MSRYVPRRLRDRSAGTSSARAESRARPAAAETETKPDPTAGKRTSTTSAKIPQQRSKPSPNRGRPSPQRRTKPAPSPRSGAGPRPGSGRRNRRRLHPDALRARAGHLTVAAAIAVLAAAASVLCYLTLGNTSADNDGRGAAVSRAAKAATSALFSYDYRDFDASIANGAAYAYGAFADEYTTTTEGLREVAVDNEAQVTAQVVDVAVITDATEYTDAAGEVYSDVAEVLVFLNQVTRNKNIETEKIDTSRVVVTMYETDEGWKAVDAHAF